MLQQPKWNTGVQTDQLKSWELLVCQFVCPLLDCRMLKLQTDQWKAGSCLTITLFALCWLISCGSLALSHLPEALMVRRNIYMTHPPTAPTFLGTFLKTFLSTFKQNYATLPQLFLATTWKMRASVNVQKTGSDINSMHDFSELGPGGSLGAALGNIFLGFNWYIHTWYWANITICTWYTIFLRA